MRFDIISVFPKFFDVLDLSLLGKAQERGIVSIKAHDLRDWAEDVHRSVDYTPAGGGAGMVMRADIWGKAIDEVIEQYSQGKTTILAVPTPSGVPLTQRVCEDLASRAEHVIIACGRYEGIDARVVPYYSAHGVEVVEYSLGDYVLNGGEVAAVALVEAVGRLLPGMVGNPHSLVEESHSSQGLLEYPVYTRPMSWRGLDIPAVLQGGNHREAWRWRRDRALEKTATRRPDMIEKLSCGELDKKDCRKLADLGYLAGKTKEHPVPFIFRDATATDVSALQELSVRTFPDACPSTIGDDDIDAFIAHNFSEECWLKYVNEPQWQVVVCEAEPGDLVAYTLCLVPEGDGIAGGDDGAPSDVLGDERCGPLVELSKFYIDRPWRSVGIAPLLWEATRSRLSEKTRSYPRPFVWLGTNEGNRRAHKAYKKMGFVSVGRREFYVGDVLNSDIVFACPIHMA